jgi:single-strand DNA-binding protein
LATLNKVILIGHLGADPEMRYTPDGKSVTSFRLATTHRYTTSKGETREETDWFRVTVWGRQAEQCNQYLKKGQQVYVEGRLHAREWQTQDGQTRTSLEVTSNNVVFLGRPSGSAALPDEGDIVPDDIPFDQN